MRFLKNKIKVTPKNIEKYDAILNDDIKNNLMVNNSLKEKRDSWMVHTDNNTEFQKGGTKEREEGR